MAELIPARFADLVTRLYLEPRKQDALFELPRRKWYLPKAGGPDLSVRFHDKRAGNPSGPAAGPHTQMAQNLLLSYVAGGRILELKTVQINDRLTIGRPCIDLTNVGYNIEWSQELLVEDSLREYVAGMMLIEMFRRSREHAEGLLDGPCGEVICDISVGYDLAGIKSEKIVGFLNGMRNAGALIDQLRGEIPDAFREARGFDYPTDLSSSITLSTFHGCPADEIERITEFLVGELGFDVIVKMNPPTLGKERLEHLLFDVLGYTELVVNPAAYTSVMSFDESVQLGNRLTGFARARNRRVGFKFSNTLEVLNHRDFFTPDNKVMYLSGQPLHVITMTLTDEFRRAVGAEVPISFSAGIDQHNFAAAVACGFVPITVSSDLLRPGGYARFSKYLEALAAEMGRVGASTVDEFILRWGNSTFPKDVGSADPTYEAAVCTSIKDKIDADISNAALSNTTIAAEVARNDPRYRADKNRSVPKRIDSHLTTFDCITCDKCMPVCPNAANFTYPTPKVDFECHDLVISPDGQWRLGQSRRFAIEQSMQIACYSDFCNECGNCDTFCPEYGGPYIKKPTFFGSLQSWRKAAPRDGFAISQDDRGIWISARMKGRTFELFEFSDSREFEFTDGTVTVRFNGSSESPVSVSFVAAVSADHVLDMWTYHTLRHLLSGVLDRTRVNQVNAAFA